METLATTSKSQINSASIRKEIHLIFAARANESVTDVIATIKEQAQGNGYDGSFILQPRSPKPRTIGSKAFILTDHPSRLARSPQELLALLIAYTRIGAEVEIMGHFHVRPNSEVAAAFIAFDEMRKSMKSARIREGLFLAKQRGVSIGRKRISRDLTSVCEAVKENGGSYRSVAKTLKSQGHNISKSTIHAILRKNKSDG